MSVIYLSSGSATDTAQCSICRKYLPLTQLSVGICDTQGNQTFFCDVHYLNVSGLIVGLADYMADERQRHISLLGSFEAMYGE